MTDGIFKIPHALLQCGFATLASSGKGYFSFSWIGEGLWLFSPVEYGRSDALRIARLAYKREYSFHPVCWNMCTWGALCLRPVKSMPMLRLSCCEEAKPHGEATCSLYDIPAQVTDMLVNKPADDSTPELLSHLQTSSLLRWGQRHCRAETQHPYCALPDFQTHRIHEYDNIVACCC